MQLTAVSQITVFGVPADLSPLLVVSVGLLWARSPGALFGFAIGLFVDTALLQTLGVTSLVLTAVGYGAGRLRELRDPAHGLVAAGRRRGRDRGVSRSASRCCSSCSASRRRSRCCSCARSCSRSCSTPCSRCRSTRSCAACWRRSCPTTRAAAAGARTRPAG